MLSLMSTISVHEHLTHTHTHTILIIDVGQGKKHDLECACCLLHVLDGKTFSIHFVPFSLFLPLGGEDL